MNQRITLLLSIVAGLVAAGAAYAKDGKDQPAGAIAAPQGELPARYRVTGARASGTLATEIHCTNLETSPIVVYADFYQYDGSHVCTAFSTIAPNGTRTLATADSTSFAEDYVCSPVIGIGQGSVHISVGTPGAKFICSAEIVSLSDDPPTTLGALDVWPAN